MSAIFKKRKDITPLPFVIYWLAVLAGTCIGIAVSTYLAISHYRVYSDIGYKSFCAISKALNCDTVSQSPYSIFWNVPVSIWGIVGYIFLLISFLYAGSARCARRRLWALLFLICAGYCSISLILAYISIFYIKSYCIMCIATYGVNFFLLFYAWIIHQRFGKANFFENLKKDIIFIVDQRKLVVPFFGVFAGAILTLQLYFPSYWNFTNNDNTANISYGVTSDGYPWFGSSDAENEIIEFFDYQCFQCKKMHYFLYQLTNNHPGKLKVIQRHFPMDRRYNPLVKEPFHEGSGELALLAIHASLKGNFSKMNAILFNIPRGKTEIDLKELASKTGDDFKELAWSLKDLKLIRRLQKDIRDGLTLGITGTPGFVINGTVYQGNIPPNILEDIFK